MPTRAGYGYTVEHFKKVEAQLRQQTFGGALLLWQLCPSIINRLCLPEDIINGGTGVK